MIVPFEYQVRGILKDRPNKQVLLVYSESLPIYHNKHCIIKVFKSGLKPREIEVHKKLSDSNNDVLKYIGSWSSETSYYLSMELCAFGDLYNFIETANGIPPSFIEILNISLHIAKQLENLHKLGYAHRDIKPHNIFLTVGRRPVIGDFENCVKSLDNEDYNTVVGTPNYMSPEIFRAYENNNNQCENNPFRNDIYAFGKVIFELSTATFYESLNKLDTDQLNSFIDQELQRFNYNNKFKQLIKDMLKTEMYNSIDVKEVYSRLDQTRNEIVITKKMNSTRNSLNRTSIILDKTRDSDNFKSITSDIKLLARKSSEILTEDFRNSYESRGSSIKLPLENSRNLEIPESIISSNRSSLNTSYQNLSIDHVTSISLNSSPYSTKSKLPNKPQNEDLAEANYISLYFSRLSAKPGIFLFLNSDKLRENILSNPSKLMLIDSQQSEERVQRNCAVCKKSVSEIFEKFHCGDVYHNHCIKASFEKKLESCETKINFLNCLECNENISFSAFISLKVLSKKARTKANLLYWSHVLAICPFCEFRTYKFILDEKLKNSEILCQFCRMNFCPTCSQENGHFFWKSCSEFEKMKRGINLED